MKYILSVHKVDFVTVSEELRFSELRLTSHVAEIVTHHRPRLGPDYVPISPGILLEHNKSGVVKHKAYLYGDQ